MCAKWLGGGVTVHMARAPLVPSVSKLLAMGAGAAAASFRPISRRSVSTVVAIAFAGLLACSEDGPGTGGSTSGEGSGGSETGSGGATTASDTSGSDTSASDTSASGTSGSGTGTSGSGTGGDTGDGGYDSELDLILTGDTVPGNVELGLASSPETTRNPGGTDLDRLCFDLINDERMNAGLEPYPWDGDLTDLARSHSDDMEQLAYFSHGSSTQPGAHLYQERAEFLGLKNGKFQSVVEDAGQGTKDIAAMVAAWMGSPGHRGPILGEGGWDHITHMGCAKSTVGTLWSVEFGSH